MRIQIEQIDKGQYIIGDREYGYTICRVDFALETIEQLSEDNLIRLANDIKDVIVTRLNLDPGEVEDRPLRI